MNWKDYFAFSKGEQIAVWILMALIVLTALIPTIYLKLFPPQIPDFKKIEAKYLSWKNQLVPENDSVQISPKTGVETNGDEMFFFDPNNAELTDWLRLGLSEKQAAVILNYVKKGGRFSSPAELKKMFVISDAFYKKVEAFIRIAPVRESMTELFSFNPNVASNDDFNRLGLSESQIKVIRNYLGKGGKFKTKEDFAKMHGLGKELYSRLEAFIQIPAESILPVKKPSPVSEKLVVELNAADTSQLALIIGIGKSFARRIVKYREKLGGFCKKEQLLEVYGLEQELYDKIKENIEVNDKLINKINLNFDDVETLAKHPYIGWDVAKAIEKRRKKTGPFSNSSQLMDEKLIPAHVFNKLKPYLFVDN